MMHLQIEDGENIAFWMHTKAVFNYKFHTINTNIHTLANGKDWWENLPISGKSYSLKSLAIMLFSIVPHMADVEQLFVDLSGIQDIKHCNLMVRTFEILRKLQNNYFYHVHQLLRTWMGPALRVQKSTARAKLFFFSNKRRSRVWSRGLAPLRQTIIRLPKRSALR
jgi:hypothetical protein